MAALIAALLVVLTVWIVLWGMNRMRYNRAIRLMSEGNYKEAYQNLKACGGYGDSAVLLKDFTVIRQKTGLCIYERTGQIGSQYKYAYDHHGRLILEEMYGAAGRLMERWTYVYDARGWKSQRISERPENERMNTTQCYTYDTEGRILSEYQYNSEGTLSWKYEYQYDVQGNVLQKTETNAKGETVSKHEYTYDDRGNQIRMLQYDRNGLAVRQENAYDANNRECSVMYYGAAGRLDRGYEYIYSAAGEKLTAVAYEEGGSTTRYTYQYDHSGRVIQNMAYSEDGILKSTTQFDYDTNGNNTAEIAYGANNVLMHKSEYAYDAHGNQTMEAHYNGTQLFSKQERMYDEQGNLLETIYYNQRGKERHAVYNYEDIVVYQPK
jgi:hypothetical protein